MIYKGLKIEIVDFKNAKESIEIQRKIFPEDGLLNILASINRDLFMKTADVFYPDDNVKYYLAYKDEVPIGITGLYYYQEEPKEMWLAWFGVIEEYRNRGYGKIILEWSMQEAVNQGKEIMRLYTDLIENAEAIKLYEKMGFTREKYLSEKLTYDCYIYSTSLYDDKLVPFDNRNLGLARQSGFENIDENKKRELYEFYDKNYFK